MDNLANAASLSKPTTQPKDRHLPVSLCFSVTLADFVVIFDVGLPVVSSFNIHPITRIPYGPQIHRHERNRQLGLFLSQHNYNVLLAKHLG